MNESGEGQSRREFIETAAAIGAVGAVGALATACSGTGSLEQHADYQYPQLLPEAPDGPVLRAGVVGCGGRGTGAASQFIAAGPNLEITALGDYFQDRIDNCRQTLLEDDGVEIPDENCFNGFDAYHQVIESGVDLVILATPPYFRPEHFEACIENRKHVFMEKPVAVDPVGARSVMASARQADGLGLSVVTGTQRRHQLDYVDTFRQVAQGTIGDVVSANVYWNGTVPWYRERQRGWTDMEYMLRDWVNRIWLSGDHIVEQHVHNLDVANWFLGGHPVSAVGMGGRHRREQGDQYDFFSIDYVYENDIHVHSMCRQISGCANNISELVRGTRGYTNCVDTIWDPDSNPVWEYPYEQDEEGNKVGPRPYFQEHIDLVTAIRTQQPINEAENTAISTLAAIMGRTSAYTGKEVTWDEMMESGLKLGPDQVALGPSDLVTDQFPVPGVPKS
jgi:predicted dehydrogenase